MSYRPAANGGYDNHGAFLEQQNDQMTNDLHAKVAQLKRVTIAIGDDVRDQNRLLNSMEGDFDLSNTLLGQTMKKLGIVSRAGGNKVLCYLVLFAFFVFLVIYYVARG
ncbi:unnamed protein product [Bursaphelenchus okinawaensis]|uniref:t-SNARE coiled-coil homology domain-containing protein n=1 Tax=Bursaphelenchus okinawaensis TaxID=465554 RepID=A0A811KS82_9BILA|nr:unnamed protein product [Bursaphelenchus okinawaensis]CAG9111020.1 unnamed protein product [Bursaphelenchus okinawaensis]